MEKSKFVLMMNFPDEWLNWDMYPDELSNIQISDYAPGDERASEHFRYGAFLWWLAKYNNPFELDKLEKLAHLDPESGMANDVIERIHKAREHTKPPGAR